MYLTSNEMVLLSKILADASSEYSRYGCNDIPEEWFANWSKEEKQNLMKEFHKWNNSPEDYDPDNFDLPDWALVAFYSKKLLSLLT